jgi:hypothetical protein
MKLAADTAAYVAMVQINAAKAPHLLTETHETVIVFAARMRLD